MNKVPGWYWAVAIVALLWGCMGCGAYLMQVTMDPADIAKLPKAQQDIWGMTPGWVLGAYAIAVWFGLFGAIALLLRRRFARSLFVVSVIAVFVQFGWTFTQTPILQLMSFGEAAGFPIFITVFQIALLWFSDHAIKRGWLR
jgi:hypothetical protein